MKQTKKGFVQVPVITLNALKGMLFSNSGMDLSAIIDDLTPDEAHRDITAINVALAYKGVEIDIDKNTRYKHLWKNSIKMYEYVGHSIILGTVKAQSYDCHIDETEGTIVIDNKCEISCYSINEWEEMTTDISEILKKIQK